MPFIVLSECVPTLSLRSTESLRGGLRRAGDVAALDAGHEVHRLHAVDLAGTAPVPSENLDLPGV